MKHPLMCHQRSSVFTAKYSVSCICGQTTPNLALELNSQSTFPYLCIRFCARSRRTFKGSESSAMR
ncbi:hypothetical protein BaRGS_00026474, partial [Batillaria attramentaria]